MVSRLVAIEAAGSSLPKTIRLPIGKTSIGRAGGNDVLLDDPESSKRHAEITVEPSGVVVLRDLGSSNGTFVNGEPCTQRELSEGDIIEIGACTFCFEQIKAGTAERRVTLVDAGPLERTRIVATSDLELLDPDGGDEDDAKLNRRYERLRAAFEAVGQLIELGNVDQLCRRILDVTFELVRAETGAVLLVENGEAPVTKATRDDRAAGGEILLSRTILEQVIREGKALLAIDALADTRWSSRSSVILAGVRSLMCVPLAHRGRVLGLLHVGSSSETGAFTETDLDLLAGIGGGAAVALANALMAQRLAEEARARESLGRFLSPVLVDQVMRTGMSLARDGKEREVTVMFADIRGFTSLTERTEARDVVNLLNEYFELMVEVVFKNGGALDKYIGDALMALWGIPQSGPDDAAKAIRAAHEMLAVLESLNALRHHRGQEPLGVGIGLATGPCICGAIGAARRMDYTAIGDAVNLASRLAGLAAAGEVICDSRTHARGAPSRAERLQPVTVKGKREPVRCFRLG